MGKEAFWGMPPSNFAALSACIDGKPKVPGWQSPIAAGGCRHRVDWELQSDCGKKRLRKRTSRMKDRAGRRTMTSYQTAAARPPSGRWLQLLIGIVCMVMIANLQYGWTLFVGPIGQKHGWDRASIQVAFTIFVLTETWL